MDGSDPAVAVSRDKSSSPRGWLRMVGSLIAVVAIVVATRVASSPKAVAQLLVVKAGSPSAPPRPANPTQLPPAGQQPQRQQHPLAANARPQRGLIGAPPGRKRRRPAFSQPLPPRHRSRYRRFRRCKSWPW